MQEDDQASCIFRFYQLLLLSLFKRNMPQLQLKFNAHPLQLTTPRFEDKAEAHFKQHIH